MTLAKRTLSAVVSPSFSLEAYGRCMLIKHACCVGTDQTLIINCMDHIISTNNNKIGLSTADSINNVIRRTQGKD